ncbi:MAG: MFS transporter [Deltaproteobacteria bacterium]|nr:MFS transporter [Deltaproteobacteria bacterium]
MSKFKVLLWKYYLYRVLIHIHFFSGVLVPFFTDWGGITFTQVMILQSWFMFWIFALEIPTGSVADYFGRKYSIALGCFAHALGCVIYVIAPQFLVFLIAEFLMALGMSLISGANEAFIYDSLVEIKEEHQSKKIFARAESFGLSGIMISAPIGSWMASLWGLQSTMFLTTFPTLLGGFIALSFKEPKLYTEQKEKKYFSILKEGTKYFLHHKILKVLAFDMILIQSVAYFMIWLYQPKLQSIYFNIVYFGLVHASFVLSQTVMMNYFEKLEKIFRSKKRLIFLTSFLTGCFFLLTGFTNMIVPTLLGIILGGGIGLSRRPILISYMNKHIPSHQRATILSCVSMMRTFMLVIINPFVGYLASQYLNTTFIVLGSFALLFSLASKVQEEHLLD